MSIDVKTTLGIVLGVSAFVWWIAAPFAVDRADPRLVVRNPGRRAHLIGLYRTVGLVAMIVGLVLALAL